VSSKRQLAARAADTGAVRYGVIVVVAAVARLMLVSAAPACAHGGAVDVAVTAEAGLVRAAVTWKRDHEPVTEYLRLGFTAVDPDGRSFGPYPLEADRGGHGRYVSQEMLPPGIWQVTVTGTGRFRVWGAATVRVGRLDSTMAGADPADGAPSNEHRPGWPMQLAVTMVAVAMALMWMRRGRGAKLLSRRLGRPIRR
jgi:hypothetical protein